jgi:hypothetical protein
MRSRGNLVAALGVTPVEAHINAFNYMALLPSAQVVRELKPDVAAIAQLDRSGGGSGFGPTHTPEQHRTAASGPTVVAIPIVVVAPTEIEHVEQIADGRHVPRDVGTV